MSDRTRKYILYSIGILFIGSIFWSIIAETLLPLLRAGDTRGFFLNLFGIPLTLLGTGAIVYGGYRFVVSTLGTFVSPEMQANIDVQPTKCEQHNDATCSYFGKRGNWG